MKPQILLTNDDGILSPGLWAAAGELEKLGFVHVVAPREQSTGMGRSLPSTSSGIIEMHTVPVNGRNWQVYAVDGTPAQAVIHGVLEILPEPPRLVVSGINYGENFGTGLTISGTVGAAMEAAGMGIPALAVSLVTDKEHHFSYSAQVDFSAAAYYAGFFARRLLEQSMPADVDLLKLEVPLDATPQSGWSVAVLGKLRYYESLAPVREKLSEPGKLDYRQAFPDEAFPPNSDVYVTKVNHKVAVTPVSLDMTSRTDLGALERLLRSG